MSSIFTDIQRLVQLGEVRISNHGYDELAEDGIFVKDIIESISDAILVEDYPDYPKGACVLVLQKLSNGDLIHTVWGIPKGMASPAVLITAYRPDLLRWEDGFMRRKK